jgi:molybdopterin/thiamine biosynthesis adenylyltransferase
MQRNQLIVLVGAGGVGAPAALALAASAGESKDVRLRVVDDDRIERSNLHRQILFREEDVGRHKLDAFAAAVAARAPDLPIEVSYCRALPSTAVRLVSDASVVIDATDNFSSRFLLADACAIAEIPVVHAAAVRWTATVMAVPRQGRPCYRCLFEDLPSGNAPDCATAGIVGPVCGVSGAIAADRALRVLGGDTSVYGAIVTYDGRRDVLRQVPVHGRADCPLCGSRRSIWDLDPLRYQPARCEYADGR